MPPSLLRHGRSKSFAYGFEPSVPLTLPAAPSILPTGATHLMPVLGPLDTSLSHTSYKAVPDLGFVPVVFTSNNALEGPIPLGPLQRSASGGNHKTSPSLSSMRAFNAPVMQEKSVVLVPAKIETVECSIPIKVYPGYVLLRILDESILTDDFELIGILPFVQLLLFSEHDQLFLSFFSKSYFSLH